MAQPLIDYLPQYEGSNSVVLAGGSLTIFHASTTNLVELYSDFDLTVATANPATLDAAGMPPTIFYAQGVQIKIELKDAAGNLIKTRDNLTAFGGPTAGVSVWASDQTYVKSEEVVYLGARYFSNKDNNIGKTPTPASEDWTLSPLQGIWNTNLTYSIGDRVIDPTSGILYISLANTNAGSDPTSSPDKWGQADGIGRQTVNISAASLAVPGTGGATLSTETLTNVLVPSAEFEEDVDESAQFHFRMPDSYDPSKPLKMALTYYLKTTSTAAARFIVTAYGIGGDVLFSTINFSNQTQFIDLTGLVANTQYLSAEFNVNESGTLAPGDQIYFQVLRKGTTDSGTQSVFIAEMALIYNTTSSADNASA